MHMLPAVLHFDQFLLILIKLTSGQDSGSCAAVRGREGLHVDSEYAEDT